MTTTEDENLVWFRLEPDCGQPVTFAEFLKQAARDESLFDSAWLRAKRKIIAGGFFNPAGDGDEDPYLLGLAAQGIRSYKVFAGIQGSEYVVHQLIGNEPVDSILMLIGPPGSGKTMILKRWLGLILGETFYMVDGCPNNCRPESLLRLLSEEQISPLPKEFGNIDSLIALRHRTIEPCEHCKEAIFGSRIKVIEKPRLDLVKIQPVKLLVRAGHGASFWTPSDSPAATPLEVALKQGSHVCVVGQPFGEQGFNPGRTPLYHTLLEAVQGRHVLSDGTPFGGLVVFETNQEGHDGYMKSVHDKGAYVRRIDYVFCPYLGVVSRERQMYEEMIEKLRSGRQFRSSGARSDRGGCCPFAIEAESPD